LASCPGMLDMAYVETATHGHITADEGRVIDLTARYETLHSDALGRTNTSRLIREVEAQWK
jgi:hypothetical protein